MSTPEIIAEWENPELLSELEVCLTCHNLRGRYQNKEHRCACQDRGDAWRKVEWDRYDIAALIDLCQLCARGTMKSGSRYSWLACDLCLEVSRGVGTAFGSEAGALPLGRHSLMNRISLGGGVVDEAAVAEFSKVFTGLASIWQKTFEWAQFEAVRLSSTLEQPTGSSISLLEWRRHFPNSIGASVDAFCRFSEYDLPTHQSLIDLVDARNRFLSGKVECE